MNELSWANGSQGQVLMGGEERERERERIGFTSQITFQVC